MDTNEQLLNAAKMALASLFVQLSIASLRGQEVIAPEAINVAREQLTEAIEAVEGQSIDPDELMLTLMQWGHDRLCSAIAAEEENDCDAPDLDPGIWEDLQAG